MSTVIMSEPSEKQAAMQHYLVCGTEDCQENSQFYTENYALQQDEFSKIQKYFLPTTQGLKSDIEADVTKIQKLMESIRTSMKAEAESLKNLVDEVSSKNIEHTHIMEITLLKMLKSQETTYDDYIAYLGKMSDEFQQHLSSETLKIKTIPETTKPVPPVFTAGQFSEDDVAELLGRVNVPNAEPKKRKIQPMEAIATHMKSTEKQLEQSKDKSDMKQTLSVTKVREYSVQGVEGASHVSVDKSRTLWVSNGRGALLQIDLQGKLLQITITSGGLEGNHTATQDGDLIYTAKNNEKIYRITPDRKTTEFIKTGGWRPLSVHSSRINGDILVGMNIIQENAKGQWVTSEAKVTRYSKAGNEIQNIQRDNQGQELYSTPHHITENINGDICTSDWDKQAVVVVNKSGEHRFSYTGQGSGFHPFGICTDVLGHILVCDSDTVHLLDQDGGFLSVILSLQQGVKEPLGLCVDDENNLYVGQSLTNTVPVYKYLQ